MRTRVMPNTMYAGVNVSVGTHIYEYTNLNGSQITFENAMNMFRCDYDILDVKYKNENIGGFRVMRTTITYKVYGHK